MTVDDIKDKLQKVLNPKRFSHSLGVMDTAGKLASLNGIDVQQAELAGLLHDCAKGFKGKELLKICEENNIAVDEISALQPELLHGPVGAALARKEYGIEDEIILSAIYCHTTGRENMGVLDKVIFLSDYIEPGRKFPGVEEVRKAAYKDLNKAMVMSLSNIIKHLVKKRVLIQKETVNAWNYFMLNNGE